MAASLYYDGNFKICHKCIASVTLFWARLQYFLRFDFWGDQSRVPTFNDIFANVSKPIFTRLSGKAKIAGCIAESSHSPSCLCTVWCNTLLYVSCLLELESQSQILEITADLRQLLRYTVSKCLVLRSWSWKEESFRGSHTVQLLVLRVFILGCAGGRVLSFPKWRKAQIHVFKAEEILCESTATLQSLWVTAHPLCQVRLGGRRCRVPLNYLWGCVVSSP